MNRRETLLLASILVVGAVLRLYGLNWDGGHWLHPDERQIYFITLGLGWPRSLAQALSPDSPLNPDFFAYGSLPIYLLKIIAALPASLWPALRDPDNLHLVGRPLAALFDLGTVYLTYRLARILLVLPRPRPQPARGEAATQPPATGRPGMEGATAEAAPSGKRGALLAAALVSLAVLHIQLAHFYTADPLLTFFVMLTLNLAADVALGGGRRRQVALGVALGLALATKVSAAPLILAVLVAYHSRIPSPNTQGRDTVRGVALTLVLAIAIFFLIQPYALIDWPTFVDDTIRETQIARGALGTPYTIQYAGTLPVLYSMWQTALWGLVLPLGLVAWGALTAVLIRWLRRGTWTDALLLAWAGPYLAITGLLHARYLRYMLPLVPILCLMAAQPLTKRLQKMISGHRPSIVVIGRWSLIIASLVYALVFASIYAAPHPWIVASAWIYRQVPAGSTLAVEDWDVALPLPLDMDGQPRRIEEYEVRTLTLYDEPDDAAKWQALAADLAGSDYAIVASRRLYGSLPRVPARYPVASRYHELLFSGNLGFELVGEFTRAPAWLNPRLPPLPDAAPSLLHPDESFVVYDHPRTLVFRNTRRLPADALFHLLAVQ